MSPWRTTSQRIKFYNSRQTDAHHHHESHCSLSLRDSQKIEYFEDLHKDWKISCLFLCQIIKYLTYSVVMVKAMRDDERDVVRKHSLHLTTTTLGGSSQNRWVMYLSFEL